LLVKFLDAHDVLSVQVHPDDATTQALYPGEWGKTECWVVVHAGPGAAVFAGLREGIGRDELVEALGQGTVDRCLHRVPVRQGDCVFVRAGAVHTIGQGVLVAEIQQASDLTFRLFDWNRTDADGRSRPLHVDESLRSIDFDLGPVDPVQARELAHPTARHEQVVACEHFLLDRWHVDAEAELSVDAERARILVVVEGRGTLRGDRGATHELARGDTLLVPAGVTELTLRAAQPLGVLDVRVP